MIDTLFFILQMIGIVVILSWALTNDAKGARGRITGPLAYKDLDLKPGSAVVKGNDPAEKRSSLQRRSEGRPRGLRR